MDLIKTYNECIQALDKTGRWFDEEDMEAVEATFGTNKAQTVIYLLLDYTVATVLTEASCKARWNITKKNYPKKKEREEAAEAAKHIHIEDETKRDKAYFELKRELMGEEEFMQMQQAQAELMEAWGRASREGLI